MSLDPADIRALPQLQTICCINVVSFVGMKISPTLTENVVATLKSDVEATLRQRGANIVTTLQSNNFKNALQHLLNITSVNILVFLGKLPLCRLQALHY